MIIIKERRKELVVILISSNDKKKKEEGFLYVSSSLCCDVHTKVPNRYLLDCWTFAASKILQLSSSNVCTALTISC
ncbi:hypothetical protein E1A91_A06G042900v1 [Gossypium mustelinum]|uniref:Uncharacterized protein n=1 Tax=Gossypium mustelinum TaxID=34275 RepID=A0A5D2YSE8_GOSMU|nr:hypothetical protein E1A91_A06G042900v1 [Gossypium mustelinum]